MAPGADIRIFFSLQMWQEFQSHMELLSLRVFAFPDEGCVAFNERCDVSTCSSDCTFG